MGARLKRTVVLVGMMGAGKTAVGGQLARMLGARFLDSDDEIVKAAAMTIPEIFERDGEAFFREKESQVLARLLQDAPCILSTGGGAFMKAENRDMIARSAVSVWLKVELDLLWERVRHRTTRPLLKTPDPRGTLKRLHEERAPFYALADVVVPVQARFSVEATAQKVLAALEARDDVIGRH